MTKDENDLFLRVLNEQINQKKKTHDIKRESPLAKEIASHIKNKRSHDLKI